MDICSIVYLVSRVNKKIAYFGEPGSFSHQAGLEFARLHDLPTDTLTPYASIKATLEALSDSEDVAYAVVPHFNSTAGKVIDFHSSFNDDDFKVEREIILPIHHCLLATAPLALKDIALVTSHTQALQQCRKYLATNLPQAELMTFASTSGAAKQLTSGTLPEGSAAIGSKKAAAIYGLKIVAENIEDEPDNKTHFYVVSKKV